MDSKLILEAEQDRKVLKYYMESIILIGVITVVGIPLLLFAIPFAKFWYFPRYFEHHSLRLFEDSVEFRKGVLNRHRIVVPLERVTDINSFEGLHMRWVGIEGITIETAGQTRLEGAIKLHGVVDPDGFRKAIMGQRKKAGATAG